MSWETVKIITGATVKTLTAIDKNVQDATLGPSIHDAQYGLKEVLGETLYALLEAADPVADPTLGGDAGLTTLYDTYCKGVLAWRTKQFHMRDSWGGATRNGVHTKSGDDYNNVDARGLSMLEDRPKARADNRETELLRYLNNLADTSPIKIAWRVSVKDEPRTTDQKRKGRVSTRLSRWQFENGVIPPEYKDCDGY